MAAKRKPSTVRQGTVSQLEAELQQRTRERDDALAREAALAEVLAIISVSPGDPPRKGAYAVQGVVRRLVYFGCLFLLCVEGSRVARGETLDDLKGLSIQAMWEDCGTFRKPPGEYYHKCYPHLLKLYVSTNGNIFNYKKFGGSDHYTVAQPDKAKERSSYPGRGLLLAWSMIDGHLSQIAQYTVGFYIVTISIDPANLRCTLGRRLEPAADSRGIWRYDVRDNQPIEIKEMGMGSATCTAKKGNIFATDQ